MRTNKMTCRRWGLAIRNDQADWLTQLIRGAPFNASDVVKVLLSEAQKRDPTELRLAVEKALLEEKMNRAKEEYEKVLQAHEATAPTINHKRR